MVARLPVLALSAGLLLALAFRSTSAEACSPAPPSDEVLIPDGATLPANVRGIPVLPADDTGRAGARGVLVDGNEVKLISGGQVVPASLVKVGGDSFVVPTSPFVPGAYRVELNATSLSFTVAPRAPLPTPALVVSVGAPRRARVRIPGGSACEETSDASVLDVTVSVAEDYRPYRALVVLDGEKSDPNAFSWTLADGEAVFGPFPRGLPETLTKSYTFARRCTAGAGRGSIRMSAHLLGVDVAAASASAELDFPACETFAAEAPPAPAAPAAEPDAGGCSAARTRPPTKGAPLALGLALGALACGLRRRRR